MQTLCFRFVLLCQLLVASIAQAAPEIPVLNGRVVDAGNMLSAGTEAQLSQALAAHETSTSNQLAVLTVPDLQGYDVATFALEVARKWQLGQNDINNGVLLLVARDERKIRIEVGFGLEGDLTDAQSKRIIQSQIQPAFKQGDFDQGVIAGVTAITGTIDGSYVPTPEEKNGLNSPFIPLGFIGMFGAVHFLQGRVHKKHLNAVMGGSFAGAAVGLATTKWYFGVLAALAFGAFLYNARSSTRKDIHGDDPGRGRFGQGGFGSGGFGGGGFRGGGGGFGGGGASGGW